MKSLKEFFTFHPPIGKNISGKCGLCGKTFSDNVGSTGNFHKHLKRKHLSEYRRSTDGDLSTSNKDSEDDPVDTTDKFQKINQAILEDLIVKCNLPPAIVEHVSFRRFLKGFVPKWKPTSSKHITRTLLPSLVNNIHDKIKALLNDIDHLCVTIDVWTDRRGRSYIGITGHFLDSSFKPQALLLDFSRLKGPHTGENIRSVTIEILENLQVSIIIAVIS